MADEILPNLSIELPDVGADDDAWGNILNDGLRKIDQATTLGILTKTLSNVNVTLTNSELTKGVINLVGAITANVAVIIQPSPTRLYHIRNATTGAFTVTVRTPSGTGVQITQGFSTWVYSDGVNIVHAGTSLSNTFYINNGNVGIGTFGPTATLSVQNTGAGLGQIARFTRFNGADNAALRVDIDAGQNMVYLDSTGAANGGFTFRRGGSDSVVFNSLGNVGIGVVSNLTERLEVSGSINASTASSDNFNLGNQRAFMDYVPASNTARFGHLPGSSGSTSGVMSMLTNGIERARITSSGRFSINSSSPPSDSQFFVTNNVTNEFAGTFTNSSSGGYGVSIGTNSANLMFFYANAGRTGGPVGAITHNGSSTFYGTSSDYRLKHDIQPMTGALGKVHALNPVTYKWNVDNSAGEGFIAHELAQIAPQCVTGTMDEVDADGNPVYQRIDTSFLVALLTAAIQEQQAQIENLKARLTALEQVS